MVQEYVVVPAVPDVGVTEGATMLTGAATVVVNEAPVTTWVSPVLDVIVRVGVYVVPALSPVIERDVAVVPV